MTDKIIEQILMVRRTVLTNMFDTFKVMKIAEGMGLNELAKYLANCNNSSEYSHFILTGKRKED